MLAIPSIKPKDHVSFTPLKQALSNQHSYNEETIQKDVSLLETYRREAISVVEPSEIGQHTLLRYYHQIKALIPRLLGIDTIPIQFEWIDAFASHRKLNSTSLWLECGCILWNLGAFESLRGARLDRSTEEGIRQANRHFQQAAGYFEHCREQVLPSLKGNNFMGSLSSESLNMAKMLMLAQAQLCFYEKAVKDKKKDSMKASIIAKLAKQSSIFYSNTSVACKVGSLGSLLDNSWFLLTDFQSKCFHGASEYWAAVAAKESAAQKGEGYGEEVARLLKAEHFVSAALGLNNKQKNQNIVSTLVVGAESLLRTIQDSRRLAENDLRTIYMEGVPDGSTLEEVGSVAMVKPSNVPDKSPEDPMLFKFLLPKSILDSNKNFSSQINELLAVSKQESENATNEARTRLSAVGLPGSLEAHQEGGLPPGVWAKVERVRAMGGTQRLKDMSEEVFSAAKRSKTSFAGLEESFAREEHTDHTFKLRYPDYSGPTSVQLNADIRKNVQLMKDAFQTAQKSDLAIQHDLNSSSTIQTLQLLELSHEQLTQTLDSPGDKIAAPVSLLDFDEELDGPKKSPEGVRSVELMSAVEDKLHALTDLIEARENAVQKLVAATQLNLLDEVSEVLASGGDVYAQYQRQLAAARQERESVSSSVQQQQTLLEEVLALNTEFVAAKKSDPSTLHRLGAIQNIEQAVAKFLLLQSQLSAGQTFYSSLQAKLTTLQQSCDDVAFTQQWQRQEYETNRANELQRQSQENEDRLMAIRIAQEVNASEPTPGAPPVPGPTVSNPGGGAVPMVFAQPSPPVSAPTPGFQQYQSPPAPAVYGTPAYPSNPSVNPSFNPSTGFNTNNQGFNNYTPSAPGNNTQASAYPSSGYSNNNNPTTAGYQYNATPLPVNTVPSQQQHQNAPINYSPTPMQYQHQQSHQQTQHQPQHFQPQQPQQMGQQQGSLTPGQIEERVGTLCEMGFSRDASMKALQANNFDTEAALNSLLSSASGDGGDGAASGSGSGAPPKPVKPSGLFGNMWGK